MVDSADMFATVLAPLANEGGPSKVLPLVANSPAVDGGGALDLCPATDQRGVGFERPRTSENRCDIGAFEQFDPRLSLHFESDLAVLTEVIPGTPVVFTITIANAISVETASGIAVTNLIPAEIVTTSVTVMADSGVTVTPVAGPNYRWIIDNLNGGQMVKLVINGVVSSDAWDKTVVNTSSMAHTSGTASGSTIFTTAADTVAPTFPDSNSVLIYPIQGETLLNKRPTFRWATATDSGTGVVSYTVVITPAAGAAPLTFSSVGTSFTPSTDLPLGDYSWSVKAHDAVGNVGGFPPSESFAIRQAIFLPLVVNGN